MKAFKHKMNEFKSRWHYLYGINQRKILLDPRKYFITPNNLKCYAYMGEQHEALANRILDANPYLRNIWDRVRETYGSPSDAVTFLELYGYIYVYNDPPYDIHFVYSEKSTKGQKNDIDPTLPPFKDHVMEFLKDLTDEADREAVLEIINAILMEREKEQIKTDKQSELD